MKKSCKHKISWRYYSVLTYVLITLGFPLSMYIIRAYTILMSCSCTVQTHTAYSLYCSLCCHAALLFLISIYCMKPHKIKG